MALIATVRSGEAIVSALGSNPQARYGITIFTAWQANPTDILARNRGRREVETLDTTHIL
jgi:hypothetical protein